MWKCILIAHNPDESLSHFSKQKPVKSQTVKLGASSAADASESEEEDDNISDTEEYYEDIVSISNK